jgi:hypothetical protein
MRDAAHDRGVLLEGVFDLLADEVFLTVDAVQVDVMQDTVAVVGPRGDLVGRTVGVELQRQGRI